MKRKVNTRKPVATGTVTQANMRISGVNRGAVASGGAFIDFSAANVLTGKLGCLLVVKDSNGNKIQGYIKAVGTAETFNVLIGGAVENGNMETGDPPTGWSAQGGSTPSSVADERTGGSGSKSINIVRGTTEAAVRNTTHNDAPQYSLIYGSSWIKNIDATLGKILFSASSPLLTSSSTDWTQKTTYYCSSVFGGATYLYITGTTGKQVRFDDIYLAQVLTPSATGVTIVSTKGGATYNWVNKSSSFNYNDASGYKYEIYRVPAVVVASGAVTQANTRLDLTGTSACVELNGIALTAYQTGKYLIGIYDSTNKAAIGFISATAPAGEALGGEINSGTLTINLLYKITATEANHFFTGCGVNGYFTSDGTETCDANNKVKNVTEIAATGSEIVSAKGGITRAWLTKTTGFSGKDVGNYTYKIYLIGD